jgi:hypothetical protein
MKKRLFLILSISVVSIVLLSTVNSSVANSSNPPNGRAGAPADAGGANCSGCHGGAAVTATTGVISSDIPGSGYVPGTTYQFTVSMSGAGAYGFELTPQTATSNTGLGTWIAGLGTTISTKYIKQSAKKTGASAVWTFSWTAPTATTVTFYGAFNYADNTGGTGGDVIKTSSVTYNAFSTGISNLSQEKNFISVFPNPTSDEVHISSNKIFKKGEVLSMEGKILKTISDKELVSKTVFVSELPVGLYFISISDENGENFTSKFIKN